VKLLYSTAATADLDRLRAFIAEHDPAAALRIVEGLIARVERLADFPEMGRSVESTPDVLRVREFAFDAYLVRYMVSTESLIVLRVLHHREDRREDRRERE